VKITHTSENNVSSRTENIAGFRFGMLIAERLIEVRRAPSGSPYAVWRFLCDCGKARDARAAEVKRGSIVSCGCQSVNAYDDLSGKVFGYWNVIEGVESRSGATLFKCECRCGVTKSVRATHLKSGASTNCGCQRTGKLAASRRTHGKSETREFRIWLLMIDRCRNPNNKRFHSYGGRGILVCEEWAKSFSVFLADMGESPSPHHSIDRKNNNLGYFPSNCRWATAREQARNTRRNRMVEFQGKTITLVEAVEKAGANYGTVKWRLNHGVPPEAAIRK